MGVFCLTKVMYGYKIRRFLGCLVLFKLLKLKEIGKKGKTRK